MSRSKAAPSVAIRPATIADRDAIHDVHMSAFPDGENAPVAKLATDLLAAPSSPETVHLVADVDGRVAGHVAFSPVTARDDGSWLGYILAPLGVRPEHHGRGIGSRLVRDGLERLAGRSVDAVFVYGDPDYYGRFGFSPRAAERFEPPYALEYPFGWQAMVHDGAPAGEGVVKIACVAPLNDPALW